jgi:hypothetical protein
MRTTLIALSMVLVSGVAHAEDSKPQIFECINSSSLEVDSECMSNKISANTMFQQAQQKIVFEAADNSNNAFATISFYPKQHLIQVVAHRDAAFALRSNGISKTSVN